MTETRVPEAGELPDAMTDRAQWLCWERRERDGKPTKVPIEPETGAFASATDPDTWRSLSVARTHAATADCGLGFVFTETDPLVGVDLDDCREPETGTLSEQARAIVDLLDSFTEVSPSGTGVHVIVAGDLPEGRNRRGDVELYDAARFFTVTGDHVDGTPVRVADRTEALAAVHAEYVAAESNGDASPRDDARSVDSPSSGDDSGNDLSDEEVLTRARNAANSAKFERLWRGSTAGYPSHSEADMALCSLLAFWTGGDIAQMDRLFRESGLMRPKWEEVHFSDGATYGERTLERAVSGSTEFYSPSSDTTEEWEPITTDASAGQPSPTTDSGATASEDTADETVSLAELRAELAALERENRRLRAELSEERDRRRALESPTENRNRGSLGRLRELLGLLISRCN